MELRQLRYFVSVARNESFKKAAIELRIAQPALSRQISLLEHELKTPLFTRHTRGSIPTEEGRLLLEDAERILHMTEQVRQQLLFQHNMVSGPVAVGLAPTLAEMFAPELMERVRGSYPDVTLRFVEGLTPKLRQMLLSGTVDVAVLSLNVDSAYLSLGMAFSEPISLIGLAGDPLLKENSPLRMEEIADLPMIVAGLRKEGIRDIFERALANAGLTLGNVVAEVETVFMARPMVERGLGYTISISSAVEELISKGLVATRPIEVLKLDRIVARSNAHSPSRAVLEVTKILSDILSDRFPKAG